MIGGGTVPQKAVVDEDDSNWGPLDLEWLAAQRRRQQQLPADNAAAAVTVAPPSGSSDAGAPPPPPLSVEQAGSPPPLRSVNVLLLGFGNVGQAFAAMVASDRGELRDAAGLDICVRGISTASHGCIFEPASDGVDLAECLRRIHSATKGSSWRLPEGSVAVSSSETLLAAAAAAMCAGGCPAIDAVLEAVPASLQTGQPALSYLHSAIEMVGQPPQSASLAHPSSRASCHSHID
jgi:hypothetical protein